MSVGFLSIFTNDHKMVQQVTLTEGSTNQSLRKVQILFEGAPQLSVIGFNSRALFLRCLFRIRMIH